MWMGGGIFVILVLLCVIVAPIWLLLHYGTRYRSAKLLTQESERTLAELADIADRMSARIDNIEKLLDASAPNWRKSL